MRLCVLLVLAASPSMAQSIGRVDQGRGNDGGQPWIVSGTVTVGSATANQGTPNTTVNRWPMQITDGTDSADVTVAGRVQVDGSGVTQPVSGPLTDAQLRATPVPTSLTSTTITGSVAVTGPLTDAQLRATPVPVSGTVTVGTFPDNEPVNVAQMNGVAVTMGNGIAGTGVQRVAIASDNTAFSVNVGTFPDNEPMNVAQINGVAPLMGTGATGTGSQRVTLATNSPGFSTANGAIAADSALIASRAVAYGSSPAAVTAGNHAPRIADLEGIPYVNNGHPRAVFCQMAAGTGTTLAELTGCAAVASTSYYIKAVVMTGGIATAATIPALIRSGTGANCGTGTVTWVTCWHTTASDCTFYFDPPIKVTAAHALCHIDATAGTKSVMLTGYLAP